MIQSGMPTLGAPRKDGSRRFRVAGLIVIAVALLVTMFAFYYVRSNSPEPVARQYVVATAKPGDLAQLRAVTVFPEEKSAEEITKQLHGGLREAPVEIARISISDGETPDMKYVVVQGTSGNSPFTTGLTLYRERFGLFWRVGAEWRP